MTDIDVHRANCLPGVKAADITSYVALRMIWREIRKAANRDHIAIMGDLQLLHTDCYDWSRPLPKEKKSLDLMNDYALEQFVMGPTRRELHLDLIVSGTWDPV